MKSREAQKGSNFVTNLQQIGDDLVFLISNFQQMVSFAVHSILCSYVYSWNS